MDISSFIEKPIVTYDCSTQKDLTLQEFRSELNEILGAENCTLKVEEYRYYIRVSYPYRGYILNKNISIIDENKKYVLQDIHWWLEKEKENLDVKLYVMPDNVKYCLFQALYLEDRVSPEEKRLAIAWLKKQGKQ